MQYFLPLFVVKNYFTYPKAQFELFGIEEAPPAVNPKSDDFKTEVKRAIIEALQESIR